MRWASLPVEDSARRRFAEELRELVEQAAAREGLRTAHDFALHCRIAASSLSKAAGGRSVPTENIVQAILVGADRADELPQWRQRLQDLVNGVSETDPLSWLLRACADWDKPDSNEPDYRDTARLLNQEQLLEVQRLDREGILDAVDAVLWAYVLVSSVQCGAGYSRWATRADLTRTEVLEALAEVVLGKGRRPRWRAAWLLQRVTPVLRRATVRMLQELHESNLGRVPQVRESTFGDMLAAIDVGTVEICLGSAEDVSPEIRQLLLAEFAAESSPASARGKLASFLNDPDASLLRTSVIPRSLYGRERLGAYRDFYFVANRILRHLQILDLQPLEEVDSPFEGLHNRLGDVQRLPGEVTKQAAQQIVDFLEHCHERARTGTNTSDQLYLDELQEARKLLSHFNEVSARELPNEL